MATYDTMCRSPGPRLNPGMHRKVEAITEVLVPSTWWDAKEGRQRNDVAVFKLGPGPCGKTVEKLETHTEEGAWQVIQTCSDGGQRSFYYAAKDITGRVEIETGFVVLH